MSRGRKEEETLQEKQPAGGLSDKELVESKEDDVSTYPFLLVVSPAMSPSPIQAHSHTSHKQYFLQFVGGNAQSVPVSYQSHCPRC